MTTAEKTDRIIIAVLVALVLGLVGWQLFSLGAQNDTQSQAEQTASEVSYTDYDGKTIGILTGTNMEAESFKYFPNSEYLYFDGYPNLNAALTSGIIDAYLGDEPALKSIHAEQPQIDYIKKRLTENRYSFAFRKNDAAELALRDEFNEWLNSIKESGEYDEIDATWFGTDENKKVVDLDGLTGENGTIHVVTTSTDEPFSYIKDGKHVGYDIDVVARFCRARGYALEIGDVDFQARIPALASGAYEFTTTMNVTPEREEEVLFSDPVSEGGIVVAVRAEDLAGTQDDGSDAPVSSFNGKNAGVITGSFHDSVVEEYLPQSAISNYDTYADLIEALKTDKIDYFLAAEDAALGIIDENPGLIALKEPVKTLDIGVMFPQTPEGAELKAQMDEFITKHKADGSLDDILRFWAEDSSASSTPVDMSGLTAENGTLSFATTGTKVPSSFQIGSDIAGSDPDIAVRFCREYGYGIDVSLVKFAGIIPGLTTGVYDFSLADAVITEERLESLYFSVPYRSTDMLIITRSAGTQETSDESDGGFFSRLAKSFEKNFIREDRWKLILQGVGTTCLITACSVLAGSLLAFGICLFRRTGSRLANLISDWYVKLLQGTPTVVLLMILYYVCFARTGLAAVWVAVIGFTFNFGAYASEIMRSGIESVSPGQREAALALGYSEREAFYGFIFPQAAVGFLPVLRGEMISLLKSTSVVGYISILDLTKMSDIIRSRTYEAFFPLIVTALIYFALSWVIAKLMELLLARVDTRHRTRKGERATK